MIWTDVKRGGTDQLRNSSSHGGGKEKRVFCLTVHTTVLLCYRLQPRNVSDSCSFRLLFAGLPSTTCPFLLGIAQNGDDVDQTACCDEKKKVKGEG